MESIKKLFKIGRGPSSSHTIGPQRIAEYVVNNFGVNDYEVELFGSLALTGKGHGTDRILREVLGENTKIVFNTEKTGLTHPNSLNVYSLDGGKKLLVEAVSVGGGDVVINGVDSRKVKEIYPQKNFEEIKKFCVEKGFTLVDYVRYYEPDIFDYLKEIWEVMKASVERGLNKTGVINGGLNLQRKASSLYNESAKFETSIITENRKLSSYALAVAEENADNGIIVTAPTCGSAGVLPSVLYYMNKDYNVTEADVLNALAVAGVIGNVVKHNASISGAECGCQAEIGVACSMAAAALSEINELDLQTIECAAEIGLEHNLGLTCDPVLGLVQIPCIERNAMASIKAVNAMMLAKSLGNKHLISFDEIVLVMYQTGMDMKANYKETSMGGLAKLHHIDTNKQ